MLYHTKRKSAAKKKKKERARYDTLGRLTPDAKTRLLLKHDPSWGPILNACLVALALHKDKKHIAGAWVIQILRSKGMTPPNNLRTLSALGLLVMDKTTRSGNRAYYTMPDAKLISKALNRFGEI